MGYNTRYSLSAQLLINNQPAKLVDDTPVYSLIESLRAEYDNAQYALNGDGSTNNEAKWYEHTEDLVKFSAKHPNILFTLHGDGEENDDVWNKYFLNGKVQIAKAEIQIAPFDPAKLKGKGE